jgi:OmpA-OmpF porin, OOP family
MKKVVRMLLNTLCIFLLIAGGALASEDTQGCKDHPLFSRMPGYRIHSCTQKEFDAHSFDIGKGKKVEVEGRYTQINYYPESGRSSTPSELQILRNFENAVKKLGGNVVYSDKGKECLRLLKDGKEIWVEVWAEFTGKHGLRIIEKEAMNQDIVANADAFSNDIKATGHASVYGIYFDTGKSEIKPESDAALAEIAKLLKRDAGLKVNVVGHTDNVGGINSNMELSQARADAVVKALTSRHGIEAKRLRAYGVGPLAPVASNKTEDGKAKNRRVELVEQ